MSEKNTCIVAIDGPASSGKSTVGFGLAQRLNYLFFDTGILYRAVTATALLRGVAVADSQSLVALTKLLEIEVLPASVNDGRQNTVIVDGVDVTWELRSTQTDAHVSIVAANAEVRRLLTEKMRKIGKRGNTVMIGRDIGTVVAPDAVVKFFITSSAEERARRRHAQNLRNGIESNYEQILVGLRERDHLDSTRPTAPLRQASNAFIVDNTEMNVAQTVQVLVDLFKIATSHRNDC